LLTEDYFMYAEDIDLNYKLRQLGLSSYYIGQAQIVHHGGRVAHGRSQPMVNGNDIQGYDAILSNDPGHMYAALYRAAMDSRPQSGWFCS